VLLLIAVLYVLPLAGSSAATNPNEVGRIELAVSIALWARLDLGDAARVYGLSEDVAIRDAKIYSDKAPGLSTAAAPALWLVNPFLPRASPSDMPAYWPLRHILTLLLVALPTVGLAFLISGFLPEVASGHRASFALIAALATPLWTYATVFFGHAPAALLVTVAWFLLLGPPDRSTPVTAGRAALGGAAAGFAVATEYPTVLFVIVIFGALLVRRTPVPILASAAGGVLAGAVPALLYHQLAFGAPWLTGYGLKAHEDFQAIHGRGILGVSVPTAEALWGILFSARRGIFFFCPLLLLLPLGLRRMVKDRGWRDSGPILCAFVAYVLFAAGFVDWTAGWCAAARHLVPIIPLVTVVALTAASELAERRKGAVIVAVLVAISGINTVLTIVLTPFFPPEFNAPFAQLVMPSLSDGAGFANLLSATTGAAPIAVCIVVGVVAVAALMWATWRLVGTRTMWLPVVSVMTIVAALLGNWWGGTTRSTEVELMRVQVLRRLGHSSIADTIEKPLMNTAGLPEE
jgi:hypothetical protein